MLHQVGKMGGEREAYCIHFLFVHLGTPAPERFLPTFRAGLTLGLKFSRNVLYSYSRVAY